MDNICSQRNKEKFCHEGFLYIFDKKSADGSRKMWRCEHKDYSCRARIHTDAITGDVLKNLSDHNQDSNAAKIEVVRTVTAVKRRADDTNEGTTQVINHTVQNLAQAVQGQLPSGHAMKKVVRRQRVRKQAPPPMAGRLQDLIIPPDSAYRLYKYQPGLFEPFLLAEHPGPDVILFGRNQNLDLLERSKRLYIDGTFRIAPRLFSQVLVLLAEEHGRVHPIIYGR